MNRDFVEMLSALSAAGAEGLSRIGRTALPKDLADIAGLESADGT